jgi:LuxR family maltose regulon positive regulatory protein
VGELLSRFGTGLPVKASPPGGDTLIEPLTERELQVLRLIAEGLSNREIGERLFLALSTVKGHIRIIFDKLQVQRRTEAVARARELGLL